jgi:putative transposase
VNDLGCHCWLAQQWQGEFASERVPFYDPGMHTGHGHRKLVKHYEEPGYVRELTFSCFRRMPLLTNDFWRALLSRSIDAAAERHHWRLTAFVFMPEHVHLLFYPLPGASSIDRLLKAIKRPYSYRIKHLLESHRSRLLERLTIRQRPGTKTFRYWQEGPGYDRNLETEAAVLAAIDYIHMNPVRRKLCTRAIDWKWSSIHFYVDPTAPPDPALPKLHALPPEFFP